MVDSNSFVDFLRKESLGEAFTHCDTHQTIMISEKGPSVSLRLTAELEW